MSQKTRRDSRSRPSPSAGLPVLCAGVAVIAVCGMAGFHSRPSQPPPATPLPASGFDVSSVPPPPAQVPTAPAPPMTPVAVAAAPAPPASQPPAPLASARPVATAPLDAVRADGRFQALLDSPARFIAKKTLLGSAQGLRGFLSDSGRVESYVSHPLVRGVLSSAALVRAVVRPAAVHAFIGSPAMSDPATVTALARSALLREIARSPGVQQALQDPAFVKQVMLDPQAVSWLARNPEAMKALTQFSAAFGAAAITGRGN